MELVAAVRPSDWELPLFVHVLGAMVLVGGVLTVLTALAAAARTAPLEAATPLTRLAFRSALLVVVPAWLVMRAGGEWVASREFGGAEDPEWVDVGYMTADLGLPLVLATVVLTGVASRRSGRGAALAGAVLAAVLLVAYLVAVWAMTTKP